MVTRNQKAFASIDGSILPRPSSVDAGPEPRLAWLKINKLVVDPSYKKPMTTSGRRAVRAIARHFRWSRFFPAIVARGPADSFVIIDGLRRVTAAAVCGFEKVPCQIVEADLQQQADAFGVLNGPQQYATPLQIYGAALANAEPWALQVRQIAGAAGVVVLSYALSAHSRHRPERSTMAVGAVRSLIEQLGPEAATTILSIFGKTSLGEARARIGFLWLSAITAAVRERPHWLRDEARLQGFFDRMDHAAVERAAQAWRDPRTSAVEALAFELRRLLDLEQPARISGPAGP